MTDLSPLRCSPEQAGFDGAKGIGLNRKDLPDGGIYHLRRGPTDPRQNSEDTYRNQLIWYMPPGEPAQLLWCNSDGDWFTCVFERDDRRSEEILGASERTGAPQ